MMMIKIIGEAGQGIKTFSLIVGKILTHLEKHVSVSINYGTNVRSGLVTTDIIFSHERIENPKVDEPDIAFVLANGKNLSFPHTTKKITYADIDFEKVSFQNFEKTRFANMIALGKLLNMIEIKIEKIDWKELLPAKFYEENIKSIKLGYAL